MIRVHVHTKWQLQIIAFSKVEHAYDQFMQEFVFKRKNFLHKITKSRIYNDLNS